MAAAMVVLMAILSTAVRSLEAVETQRHYLSGSGLGDTVDWQFRISEGRRSGSWSTIAVPSQWQLEGFGTYAYGWQDDKPAAEGLYRHVFTVPRAWDGRSIRLVFEGVMTDASVLIDGQQVGPEHRGGFTRFSYDVSDIVVAGQEAELTVVVREHSRSPSVNRAERDADYWVFGGIYRPVYLEAMPRPAISAARIDARADGTLHIEAQIAGLPAADETTLEASVSHIETRLRERRSRRLVDSGSSRVSGPRWRFDTSVEAVRPWSAEDPFLYDLELSLVDRHGERLHTSSHSVGFRTVVLEPRMGFIVNGHKVLLKGINRHSFYPESGRTLNREINLADAELIKSMNMNAVRTSHYPPDVDFLDACDRLGLYVLDELPGWHAAYDSDDGAPLVEEMVARDHNHPSVIAWNNGNEGGWNSALDAHFEHHDLQRRPVLHPDSIFRGLDTRHYPSWSELAARLDSTSLRNRLRGLFGPLPAVLVTEGLHGLYDGGLGAGLDAYWSLIRAADRGAGFFLWTFVDEGVARDDRGGAIDTYTNFAPDGIVGPYREKEGSYWAVRDIWSPVVFGRGPLSDDFDGRLRVENRYDMTDLDQCRFEIEWLRFVAPWDHGDEEIVSRSSLVGPAVAAGSQGEIDIGRGPPVYDGVRVRALAPDGREVAARVFPSSDRRRSASRVRQQRRRSATLSSDDEGTVVRLRSGGLEARIDRSSGELLALAIDGIASGLAHGPRLVGRRPARALAVELAQVDDSVSVSFRYAGELEALTWRLDADGWLHLSYRYRWRDEGPLMGVTFDYPESRLRVARWRGQGPARVWGNRRRGGEHGVWQRRWTMAEERWQYPLARGFYAEPYWLQLSSADADLTVLFESDASVFVGLFEPRFATGVAADGESMGRYTAAATAGDGLAVLHGISSVGTKFHRADELGPPRPRRSVDELRFAAVAFFLDEHR